MENCITAELKVKIPEDKIAFNLLLPKDLNKEFKDFVLKKHGGYNRGIFTKEFELAIRNFVAKESENH